MAEFHCNCGEIITGTKRDVATHLRECWTANNPALHSPASGTAKEKVLEADARACQWLARANELIEAGKAGTKAYEEAERKAQYWLDRLNRLEGYDERPAPADDKGDCPYCSPMAQSQRQYAWNVVRGKPSNAPHVICPTHEEA